MLLPLATINAAGRPRARVVLLKGFDLEGFVFYTNYSSAKAAELLDHPYAAMNFFWYDLERQVRIEGKIEKVSAETSREYFQSRPQNQPDWRLGLSPKAKSLPTEQFWRSKWNA